MIKPIDREIAEQNKRGVFLVLSGPTASGKDTILAALQKKNPSIVRIVTTTSREARHGESEGRPYYFLTRTEFEEKIAVHDFFEWVEFRGQLYGTQKKTLDEALKSGNDIIWRIEAKGVKNIKDKIKTMTNRSVFVYLTTSNIETLEKRVRHDEQGIETARWNGPLAQWEMEQYEDCEYLVVNDDGNIDGSVEKVIQIMNAKRQEIIRKG